MWYYWENLKYRIPIYLGGFIMSWSKEYSKLNKPEMESIEKYINSPYWNDLCDFIEKSYCVSPIIEYSQCSGAPGWNVKYRKGSKALCTLYPNKDYFTCLISIGSKISMEAEVVISSVEYLKELYYNAKPFNGSRWLMIDVKTDEILNTVKELLYIRISPPKQK